MEHPTNTNAAEIAIPVTHQALPLSNVIQLDAYRPVGSIPPQAHRAVLNTDNSGIRTLSLCDGYEMDHLRLIEDLLLTLVDLVVLLRSKLPPK